MPLHGPLPSCPLQETVSLLLYIDHPPLAWALALPLVGGMSAHYVSHPHMDHTVGCFLALCPPTLFVELRTLTFHRLWP